MTIDIEDLKKNIKIRLSQALAATKMKKNDYLRDVIPMLAELEKEDLVIKAYNALKATEKDDIKTADELILEIMKSI